MLGLDAWEIATRAGFATGVVLTVPPYPHAHGYEALSKGAPISFRGELTPAENERLHFAEVALQDAQLVCSGMTGYIGVATGTGDTVERACEEAGSLARKVVAPNLRYRNDIGTRVSNDLQVLKRWGFLE
jgi:phosphoribosylamine--glycine ligase